MTPFMYHISVVGGPRDEEDILTFRHYEELVICGHRYVADDEEPTWENDNTRAIKLVYKEKEKA